MKERIGVYICHCGGNISDYVDVAQLSKIMKDEDGVIIAKNVMFACADSNQKEMVNDIKDNNLDAIVVASCSPKLHLHTFRNVAERAGLNPFNYVQVNIREQCSWPHSDKPAEATIKAAGLIRAGINRVTHSEALENIEITAKKATIIIGAGVSGMRAAIDLAKSGIEVFIIEKEHFVGGRVAQAGDLFMTDQKGEQLVSRLYKELKIHNNITLFTGATVEKVTGNLGDFNIEIKIKHKIDVNNNTEAIPDFLSLNVGAVLVTTGFDSYQPKNEEYGYKKYENVVTLPELKRLIELNPEKLIVNNIPVNEITFIYCVGNRQHKGENKYCSRYCCTSAIHTSLILNEKYKSIKSFHLFRDIRTYGKQEVLYEKSSKQGDVYIKFDEKEPPVIESIRNKLVVKVKDILTAKKEIIIETDLVVLVTGMVSKGDSTDIAQKFKIPIGNDKFFNEIHPKLKPVETVIKGVFIGGCCQGPKNISESVQSSLSAVAKINALIKEGKISLDPIIAIINQDLCTWCGKCSEVCEYDALKEINYSGKSVVEVNIAKCKGCGICAPICPYDAIEIAQFTNNEIEGMIDGFMKINEFRQNETEDIAEVEGKIVVTMKEYPQIWKKIIESIKEKSKTIPEISEEINVSSDLITYQIMTMNKYNIVVSDCLNEKETYYLYKLKS